MDQKYVAFISYKHAPRDSAIAKALHSSIEQYVIPKSLRKDGKRLGRVFRDQEELPASSNLTDNIYQALDNADHLVVVCSEAMSQSPWVAKEVDYFLQHHSSDKVYTVLVDSEPARVFPQTLLQRTLPDGTVEPVEPLAVDVRSDTEAGAKKKLRREMTRLYAAMLGCPYDALVMREQRRQRRKLLLGAGLVLAVALAFSGMMLIKNRQIDQKNTQLEASNQQLEDQAVQLQLRESELLTQNAQAHLKEGSLGSALPYALRALEGENRPYYAPAEQALIASLGVFEDNVNHLLVETNLTQNTPISSFVISSDGTQLATVDPYGKLTCFRTDSGQILWQKQLKTNTTEPALFSVPDADTLIAVSSGATAYQFSTGQILWSYTAEKEDLHQAVLSEDGRQIICLNQFSSDDHEKENYHLICLDTASGQVKAKIAAAQGQSLLTAQLYPQLNFSNIGKGQFSPDGKHFAGAYQEAVSKDETKLHCFIADLKTGKLKILYSVDVTPHTDSTKTFSISFCDNGASLLILRGGDTGNIVGILDKLDLATGQLLWQSECRLPESTYVLTLSANRLCRISDQYITVACEKHLFRLNKATGEVLVSGTADANILYMQPMNDIISRIGLANGKYGFVTINSANEISFWLPATLRETPDLQLWNKGFLEVWMAEEAVWDIQATGSGYAACLKEDDDHTVVICRSLSVGEYFLPQEVKVLQDGEQLYTSGFWQNQDGKLIIGPFSQPEGSEHFNRFSLFDPANPDQITSLYAGSKYAAKENLLFTGDGAGCLQWDTYGNLVWYDSLTGAPTVLSEKESVVVGTLADTTYTASRHISGAAKRTSDQAIIAARAEAQELILWTENQKTILTLPAGACFEKNGSRHLSVGDNGYLLMSQHSSDDSRIPDSFWAFDTVSCQWFSISTHGADLSAYKTVLANHSSRAVLLDNTQTLYVYDLQSDQLLYSFPLNLSVDAINDWQLILDDNYLLVHTRDKELLIYELSTGQVVCAQQTDSYDPIQAAIDSTGKRLYLSWQKSGVILDAQSLQELAAVPDMLFYDSASDHIFTQSYNKDFAQTLFMNRLPSTQELVQLAQKILSQ